MANGEGWTPEQDLLLLSTKAGAPELTNRQLAEVLVSKGLMTTSDAVQKRLRRLAEMEAAEGARKMDLLEHGLALKSNPLDTFVGFTIGFYDIEATALEAWKGRLLSVAFADAWGRVDRRLFTDFERENPLDDRPLAVWARDKIESFDIIVGWNNKGYDDSFLRARLLRHGERVPRFPLKIDLMWKFGQFSVRIGSRKLANVSNFLRVTNEKTALDWEHWEKASWGDPESLAYVGEHNDADVLVTRDVFAHAKQLIGSLTK